MRKLLQTFFISLFFLTTVSVSGQSDTTALVKISKISIEGNNKTKPQIITRELSFKEGETYKRYQLDSMFVWDRNRIYNTNLFNEVDFILNVENGNAKVQIQVEERWYFYPLPIFRLTDRNFGDWWVNRNRDLSRVNYGIKLTQFNFRGRNEILRLWLQTGFETILNLTYQIPYIDKKQRNGLLISSSYFEAKNVPSTTVYNIRRFTSSRENILRKAYTNRITHTYRNSFYSFHKTGLSYLQVDIADTINQINPNYLGEGKTQQRMLSFGYAYEWDKRNNVNYPTKGEWYRASITKHGLGVFDDVDYWSARVRLARYWGFKNNFFLASNLSLMTTTNASNRSYFNYHSIGFLKEVIRGYDLRLIEASSYAIHRSEFKHQLFGRKYDVSKVMPLRQFQTLPITIFGKVFYDQGYAVGYPNYEGSALLDDRYLYSLGAGIDLIFINDITFRFELSRNAENETNFFINLLSLL